MGFNGVESQTGTGMSRAKKEAEMAARAIRVTENVRRTKQFLVTILKVVT